MGLIEFYFRNSTLSIEGMTASHCRRLDRRAFPRVNFFARAALGARGLRQDPRAGATSMIGTFRVRSPRR